VRRTRTGRKRGSQAKSVRFGRKRERAIVDWKKIGRREASASSNWFTGCQKEEIDRETREKRLETEIEIQGKSPEAFVNKEETPLRGKWKKNFKKLELRDKGKEKTDDWSVL